MTWHRYVTPTLDSDFTGRAQESAAARWAVSRCSDSSRMRMPRMATSRPASLRDNTLHISSDTIPHTYRPAAFQCICCRSRAGAPALGCLLPIGMFHLTLNERFLPKTLPPRSLLLPILSSVSPKLSCQSASFIVLEVLWPIKNHPEFVSSPCKLTFTICIAFRFGVMLSYQTLIDAQLQCILAVAFKEQFETFVGS